MTLMLIEETLSEAETVAQQFAFEIHRSSKLNHYLIISCAAGGLVRLEFLHVRVSRY